MTDPDVVKLIKALLAKAESTNFPAEAEAYSAHAMRLMIKHHVDRSELDDEDRTIVRVVYPLHGPWLRHKRGLCHLLAQTMSIYDVASWSAPPTSPNQAHDRVELFGTGEAIGRMRLLLASLLVQITSAVESVEEVPEDYRGALKSYRTAWLHGWVGRVGERLAEAYASDATDRAASTADRLDELLGDAMEVAHDYYPDIETPRARAVDAEAYEAGAEAAEGVDIGQQRFQGPRRALQSA